MKFNDLETVIVIATGETGQIVDEFESKGICYYEVEMKTDHEIREFKENEIMRDE